ncbi:MAG: hypothetical protein ACLQVI_32190 [Polyangiaceae bacterium]
MLEDAFLDEAFLTEPEDITPFVPQGNADKELEWFFTMAECDIAPRPPFAASLVRVPPNESEDDTIADRVEAAHAQRTLLRWIQEVGNHDAGVLKVAYMARPWPLLLREELGRLTGVVVRLGAAEIGLPDDDQELDTLEQRTADRLNDALACGADSVDRLTAKARPLLEKAFLAYVRERGGSGKPVLRGVS